MIGSQKVKVMKDYNVELKVMGNYQSLSILKGFPFPSDPLTAQPSLDRSESDLLCTVKLFRLNKLTSSIYTPIQTGRQTNRHIDRPTDRQTY